MAPHPIPLGVLAIQASHATKLVAGLRADVQARQLDTSTPIRLVRRDHALGMLLAAEQLMQCALATLQHIAEDLPEAECFRRIGASLARLSAEDRAQAAEAGRRA
jgi:hypothetical protein